MCNVKIGDLFVSKWGYEQTNITPYQVLKVSGDWITLQQIAINIDELISESDMTRTFTLKTNNGIVSSDKKPIRRKLLDFGRYEPTLKISSYEYAHLYNGEKLYESSYA